MEARCLPTKTFVRDTRAFFWYLRALVHSELWNESFPQLLVGQMQIRAGQNIKYICEQTLCTSICCTRFQQCACAWLREHQSYSICNLLICIQDIATFSDSIKIQYQLFFFLSQVSYLPKKSWKLQISLATWISRKFELHAVFFILACQSGFFIHLGVSQTHCSIIVK